MFLAYLQGIETSFFTVVLNGKVWNDVQAGDSGDLWRAWV